MTPRVRRSPSPAPGAGSKFLKKKQPEAGNEGMAALDSDTDESVSPVLWGAKGKGRDSRPGSASDASIGHDGNKFMKKRPSTAPDVRADDESRSSGKSRSRDSDVADSIASEVADSIHGKIVIADSISEPLHVNLMDATSLGRIVLTPEPASQSEHRRSAKSKVSPFKKSRSPSPAKTKRQKSKEKKKDKKKDRSSSNVFASLGVHSVEELLGSDRDLTDESEIRTEPLDSRKRLDHSTSQIITEIQSRATPQRQVSYSEDFEPSISEKISTSERRRRTSSEETEVDDYSESFASETLSVAKTSDDDKSSHYRYSEEETDTRSEEPKARGGKKVVVEQKSVEIQTSTIGLHYQWNMTQTGVTVSGPPLGLEHVDPTPIAATVINPDALEAMTAYSPATLAIHDMLKQQIELIKQFAQAHDRLYHALTDSNVPDYHYTTLAGTKAYIRKHRKPKLTMKQALKMVSDEMDR
nr:hypothetical protein BaRGS_032603 [Batillaria attramentaria]